MSGALDALAGAVARALLRLAPSHFRRAHGEDVALLLVELVRDARGAGGVPAAARRLGVESFDLLATVLRLRVTSARATVPAGRGVAAAAAAAVGALAVTLLVADPPAERAAGPYEELVVSAHDPAGAFTLTLRHGRLVAGTVDRVPVPASRLEQHGNRLRILAEDGSVVIAADFEPPGRIRWDARQ